MSPHTPHAPDGPPGPAPGVVLIVDDNQRVLTAVSHLVQALGYDVMSAGGGREAIELYAREREHIGCILLDLTMPDMDGIETFEELSRIDPQVSVVLSSGYGEPSVRRRFNSLAPTAFLQKPYVESDLREAIETALGRRAAAQRAQAPNGSQS